MKRSIAIVVALVLICAALTPALAEGAIKRIGTLQMLNMSEEEYAAVQKLRAVAGGMLNEIGVPAEHPYYDGMFGDELEVVYFDNLNDMLMALGAGQIDAIDINQSTARYLCARNDGYVMLMDYSDQDIYESMLTAFVFDSLLSYDFSLMLPEAEQELADALDDALEEMDEDGTLDELMAIYIDGDAPAVEMPVIDGARTIRVAVTGDLPPMDFVSADGTPAGYSIAVLAEIGRRANLNFELVQISAGARAMALASGQVDMVFWSRSSVMIQQILEEDLDWKSLFDPEDAEDEAMLDRIDEILVSAFDYERYSTKDIPDGLIATARFYSDSIVLVARE